MASMPAAPIPLLVRELCGDGRESACRLFASVARKGLALPIRDARVFVIDDPAADPYRMPAGAIALSAAPGKSAAQIIGLAVDASRRDLEVGVRLVASTADRLRAEGIRQLSADFAQLEQSNDGTVARLLAACGFGPDPQAESSSRLVLDL
jgi:ribosomal protein S18 acetylase RimI-like enzyme